MAMYQIHEVDGELNTERLTKILHREPGAPNWDEKEYDWEEILDMIARRVRETRDGHLVTVDEAGKTVNRNERMASLGGGELYNEECYLLSKMDRALGLTYVEHCARL
jgi:formate dehydrogenase major subunit